MNAEAMMMMTTVGNKSDAARLAKTLVESHHAACIQVLGPIGSTFSWEGEVKVEEEWLLLIKGMAQHFQAIEQAIKQHHPYDVPEIIALPITEASLEYLGWMRRQAQKSQEI